MRRAEAIAAAVLDLERLRCLGNKFLRFTTADGWTEPCPKCSKEGGGNG